MQGNFPESYSANMVTRDNDTVLQTWNLAEKTSVEYYSCQPNTNNKMKGKFSSCWIDLLYSVAILWYSLICKLAKLKTLNTFNFYIPLMPQTLKR